MGTPRAVKIEFRHALERQFRGLQKFETIFRPREGSESQLSRLCVPSQNGIFFECLQAHHAAI
jgi:hypothetical protein